MCPFSGRLVLRTNGFQTTVKVMPSGTNFKFQTSETHGRGSLSKSLLLKMPSQGEMFSVPDPTRAETPGQGSI